jgi:hypothetical protein
MLSIKGLKVLCRMLGEPIKWQCQLRMVAAKMDWHRLKEVFCSVDKDRYIITSSLQRRSTWQPASSNWLTTSVCPRRTAWCSAVRPDWRTQQEIKRKNMNRNTHTHTQWQRQETMNSCIVRCFDGGSIYASWTRAIARNRLRLSGDNNFSMNQLMSRWRLQSFVTQS